MQGAKFGEYGGRFVPELLMPALDQLETAFRQAEQDDEFKYELGQILEEFAGRPTPLYHAKKLSKLAGCKIYLKREDLLHTGAHKINNALGQALLAKRMGKKRMIAETGAGQHGVATATAAACLGFECLIYMGEEDIKRQAPNVRKMQVLGAKISSVTMGSKTLKDAVNQAIRDWISHTEDTYYLLGSALGPHPYPQIVRYFQRIIGQETRRQILAKEERLPTHLIACVGGGSNAIGLFADFLDTTVKMIGVEAGGKGIETGKHAARFSGGRIGVLHGFKSYVLQDKDGQILPTHSISAGLDYPAIGPEHAYLKDIKRVQYTTINDTEALEAFHLLSKEEGIIPALESSHAIAYALKAGFDEQDLLVINLSGRGDKDMDIVMENEDKREI